MGHLSQITNPEHCEVIFVHNDPLLSELDILASFESQGLQVIHLKVEREPLYCSWNRAIAIARGEFLTIWNIDDIREPDSLAAQASALQSDSEAMLAYGHYTKVSVYGNFQGEVNRAPRFEDKDAAFHKFHQIGPFPMWRRQLHDLIGLFDEQFKLVADLDFQIRAAKVSRFVRVGGHLGYYLEGTPDNLSSNYKLQDLELTILHLRYGNFDRIYLTHLLAALRSGSILRYKWYGKLQPLSKWTEVHTNTYLLNFPLLIIPLLKLPRHFARQYFRPYARKYLKYHELNINKSENYKGQASQVI